MGEGGQLTCQKTAQLSTNVVVGLLAENFVLNPTLKVFNRFDFCLAVRKTFSSTNNDGGNGANS